jgi:hypothetical protein
MQNSNLMKPEASDLSTNTTRWGINEFHSIMEKNNIVLIYEGDFSQDFTKSMLTFMERKFISEEVEDTVRRKIFNVMVEILQNLSKHKYQDKVTGQLSSSSFLIGSDNNNYFIISGNPIVNDHIPSLEEKLQHINSLDKEGLKKVYKEVRLKGRFSEVSGAGIGLIDMARKSGNKLGYEFNPIDDRISFFSLVVKITIKETVTNL